MWSLHLSPYVLMALETESSMRLEAEGNSGSGKGLVPNVLVKARGQSRKVRSPKYPRLRVLEADAVD